MNRWTAILAAVILPALGLLDFVLYAVWGNGATFSVALLTIRVKYPLVAHATSYTFGVFLGHVFFPTPDPTAPATHEVLARLMLGLSPTFAALIIIAAGDGRAVVKGSEVVALDNQVKFAALMLFAHVCGLIVGRFVLAQHPLAEALP